MPNNFGNSIMKALINSPLHGILGEGMAVITVTGSITGRLISTPINVAREGEVYTAISSRERTWWRNLRGGAVAELRTTGKTMKVRGEVIEAVEGVNETLAQYFQAHPAVVKYYKIRTDANGGLDAGDLQRICGERVVIRLHKNP